MDEQTFLSEGRTLMQKFIASGRDLLSPQDTRVLKQLANAYRKSMGHRYSGLEGFLNKLKNHSGSNQDTQEIKTLRIKIIQAMANILNRSEEEHFNAW